MSDGQLLRLRRTTAGWPRCWRNLLRGLGCYDQHADASSETKHMMVDAELLRFGGRLQDVNTEEVVMWFPGDEERALFIVIWG